MSKNRITDPSLAEYEDDSNIKLTKQQEENKAKFLAEMKRIDDAVAAGKIKDDADDADLPLEPEDDEAIAMFIPNLRIR